MTNKENDKIEKMQLLFEQIKSNSHSFLSMDDSRYFTRRGRKFSQRDLEYYLESPELHSKELVEASRFLYTTSSAYHKTIDFYSHLPAFDYVVDAVEPITSEDNADALKKNYQEVLTLLNKMSLQHELRKIMHTLYVEDIFYGYEVETNKSYYIMKLDHNLCRISSVEDGVYNVSFDFSIFDGNPDLFNSYPPEFELIYNRTKGSRVEGRFVELSSKKAFAIKLNEGIPYALPPFTHSMDSAFEERDYKKIKKGKDALENFMLLTQKIPIDDKSPGIDTFKIGLEIGMEFHKQAAATLPEGVGLVTSPMDIEAIKLEKSKRDDDLVMNAKDNTLSDGGLPPNIFSTTNKTAGGIKYAVHYLEQMVFAPLRQIERWINRKLKNVSGRYKFKIRFLNTTVYNRDEEFRRYLQGAQYGFPVKQEVASAMGLSPLDFYNKLEIENTLFDIGDKMEPLSSTHTQSGKATKTGDSVRGRERLDDDEISEATETWRNNHVE